jgi:hypothetical protein
MILYIYILYYKKNYFMLLTIIIFKYILCLITLQYGLAIMNYLLFIY